MARASAQRSRSPLRLLLTYTRAHAIRRGIFGGDPVWRAIGMFYVGKTVMKKVTGGDTELVATEVLEPGQEVQIWAVPTPKEQAQLDERNAVRAEKLLAEARRNADREAAKAARKAAKKRDRRRRR